MEIKPFEGADLARVEADALVVGIYSDTGLTPAAARVDSALGGALRRLLDRGDISPKKYDVFPLWAGHGVAAPLVLVVSLGEQPLMDRQTAFRAAATASR